MYFWVLILFPRVLRNIFGPKLGEETGGWRNFVMRNFIMSRPYCSPDIIKVMKVR
jgi:hypothetical protein